MENIELEIMVDPIFDYQVKRLNKNEMNLPFLLLVSADIDWRQHSGKELSAEIFL